jgi:hypothetical protein
MPLETIGVSLTHAYPRHLDGAGWSTPRPGLFNPRKRDPVPIVLEAVWAVGSVWTGVGKNVL